MQRTRWNNRSQLEESTEWTPNQRNVSDQRNQGFIDTSIMVQNLKDNSRSMTDRATLMQQETTKQLMERLREVNKWKSLLEKEIQDIISISDSLSKQGKRLQKAEGCVNLADNINNECSTTRKKRKKVPGETIRTDKVDSELETETFLIKDVAMKIKETINEFENQIIANTESKSRLEQDWSRKKEAYDFDYRSAALTNESAESSIYKQQSTSVVANMSFPDEWVRYSTNVVTSAADQRSKSELLLQKIQNLMKDSAKELRMQSDRIDAALTDSIRKFVDDIQKVSVSIKAKDAELKQLDKTNSEMKNLKEAKDAPLRVAMTRLNERNKRPGVELCNDNAHQALMREVELLQSMLGELTEKLGESSRVGKMLNDEMLSLRTKEDILRHNMSLDSDILRNVRAVYPPQIQLTGYLL